MATVTILEETFATQPERAAATGAVSWQAVFAGATAAAALSMILLVLGMGLGLAVASPWRDAGPSMPAMSWSTILWITFTAFASSALGGYLAGRLRVRWPGTHRDEVYFRDTAHGLLAWAVASLLTAAVLTSAIGAIIGTAGTAAGAAAGGAAQIEQAMEREGEAGLQSSAATAGEPFAYVVDSLLRMPAAAVAADGQAGMPRVTAQPDADTGVRGELGRMFRNGARAGALPPEDARYAGQLISQRTGETAAAAEQRAMTAYNAEVERMQQLETQAREAADTARRNGAYASLWIFVSLLVGAFSASLMATFGGRQRDQI
jgi:hypothetical protein